MPNGLAAASTGAMARFGARESDPRMSAVQSFLRENVDLPTRVGCPKTSLATPGFLSGSLSGRSEFVDVLDRVVLASYDRSTGYRIDEFQFLLRGQHAYGRP